MTHIPGVISVFWDFEKKAKLVILQPFFKAFAAIFYFFAWVSDCTSILRENAQRWLNGFSYTLQQHALSSKDDMFSDFEKKENWRVYGCFSNEF